MAQSRIVRRIDTLGRVVLPIELRKTLGIDEKDEIEIFMEGENIVVTAYSAVCLFCGFPGELIDMKGRPVCTHCANELHSWGV
ncbi:AbrB/MazE/SpoVT family DNA-binding domain-containing protein [Alicyclobacillus sp. SO9]|uniref:AbrB/MazE/SpoVT family DNA-binding domain-containing protein n=1 Tax=Alicyclobacillus sp. SO9 TaxID=2665646 RepID=UPI0018E74E02|nr:AbrB/MazE/SpoVT family DNA-binding domain-containing protein [Alicyclobacillus sp. SO9]QQE80440.1 AbrB/MazE/SpoVT family DNA-binding domain-containing protein [Alicyclobacillus sp. SO9]